MWRCCLILKFTPPHIHTHTHLCAEGLVPSAVFSVGVGECDWTMRLGSYQWRNPLMDSSADGVLRWVLRGGPSWRSLGWCLVGVFFASCSSQLFLLCFHEVSSLSHKSPLPFLPHIWEGAPVSPEKSSG